MYEYESNCNHKWISVGESKRPALILADWMRHKGIDHRNEESGRKIRLFKNLSGVQYVISNLPICRRVCIRCSALDDTHGKLVDDIALRWNMRMDEYEKKQKDLLYAQKIWEDNYADKFHD